MVMLLSPLCPVVSVSLAWGERGGGICNGFVICSFDSAACSSFFQSRYVQVNNGTSVRRPHYWTFEQHFFFFFFFKVQYPEFLQDALIVCLGLNLSWKMEEQPRFFMVHLQSFFIFLPPFFFFTTSI